MRRIQRKHNRSRDLKGAEFLGRFSKGDKIQPIVTLVLYYGKDKWDGPRDLFQTDLREVFGFFQRSEDKYAIQQFVEERKTQFERLDEDAYDMITALTNTKEFADKKESYREEGSGINMCRAIRELIEDGKLEGLREGIHEGSQRINELNRRLLADGRQDDLLRAVQDDVYQKSLLNEYDL